jgi:hypothetical protein
MYLFLTFSPFLVMCYNFPIREVKICEVAQFFLFRRKVDEESKSHIYRWKFN